MWYLRKARPGFQRVAINISECSELNVIEHQSSRGSFQIVGRVETPSGGTHFHVLVPEIENRRKADAMLNKILRVCIMEGRNMDAELEPEE